MENPTGKDLSTGPEPSILIYKLDTQRPFSELEQKAKSLDLPDVVVEYIRHTLLEVPTSKPQEVIVVRTPSSVSLREGGKDDKVGNGRFLDALPPSLSASQSSLGYPRSVPPSPNFGYRPLESETSAVYTIISSPCVKSEDKEGEMILMAQALKQKEKAIPRRRFEFAPDPPAHIERKRKSLQFATDVCSLCFLVPGILIALLTPIFIIPMFVLPLQHYVPLIGAFLLSGTSSVLLLALSGLLGNIVWHWDPSEGGRLRPRLHCGTGPLKHFFGKSFRDIPPGV